MNYDGHHCHAKGCTRPCPPEYLMCGWHWRLVPYELQREVWRTYNPGQCDGNAEITEEWHEAADAAIDAVAEIEGLRRMR